MLHVARTHSKRHDFARPHQKALQGRLLAFRLKGLQVRNHEGRSYLINLPPSERGHDVPLDSAALLRVGRNRLFLHGAPKAEGVSEREACRRLKGCTLSLFAHRLARVLEAHFGPVPDRFVDYTTVPPYTENPRFSAARMNSNC